MHVVKLHAAKLGALCGVRLATGFWILTLSDDNQGTYFEKFIYIGAFAGRCCCLQFLCRFGDTVVRAAQ